jgi:hypothetical protein
VVTSGSHRFRLHHGQAQRPFCPSTSFVLWLDRRPGGLPRKADDGRSRVRSLLPDGKPLRNGGEKEPDRDHFALLHLARRTSCYQGPGYRPSQRTLAQHIGIYRVATTLLRLGRPLPPGARPASSSQQPFTRSDTEFGIVYRIALKGRPLAQAGSAGRLSRRPGTGGCPGPSRSACPV